MTASPLREYLAFFFESKSIPAFDLDIVEDNARRPSEEFKLVYRAVASHNLSVASCDCILGESRQTIGSIGSNSEFHKYDDSLEFGSEEGSSRWDSVGTRLRKRRSLTSFTRRKTSLVAPSRPELTPPLTNNRKKKQRSNFREALSECLIRRLPIEAQSFPIVSGKQGVSMIANEALMLSHAASTPSVMNAVVSKSA
jgi:hypothetical protein